MNLTPLTAIVLGSIAALTLGCATGGDLEGELTAEQSSALDAAIEDLDSERPNLPVSDTELRALGTKLVLRAQAESSCEQRGIVSGIWFDAEIKPVFQGAWFKLGKGELGGTVHGNYTDGQYQGDVAGPEIDGTVEGPYAQGRFDGSWTAVVGEDGKVHDGELVGHYERRNAYGGYFFGVWTDCGPSDA
jgi:hypothetical protein